MMRPSLFFTSALVFFAFSLAPSDLCASTSQARQPYVAVVKAPEIEVRSGPGNDFYSTSRLQIGDKVEVYCELENWCAIRPPLGSFSWISARYVDLGTNNVGTVVAEGLASRIGSEDTEQCDTVHVRLKKGEKVLVLDRLETPENQVSPSWYKIAPPSGEYRWIPRAALEDSVRYDEASVPPRLLSPGLGQSAKHLSPPSGKIAQVVYQSEPAPTTAPAASPATVPATTLSKDPSVPAQPPQVGPARTSAEATRPPARREQITAEDFENALAGPPSPLIQRDHVTAPNQTITGGNTVANTADQEIPSLAAKLAASRPDSMAARRPQQRAADPFQKAFEELKQETCEILKQPTEEWVFEALIQHGREIYQKAPTEADMEKVYHLIETLQRTRDVRREIDRRQQNQHNLTGASATVPVAGPLATYTSNDSPRSGQTGAYSRYANRNTAAGDSEASRVVRANLPPIQASSSKNEPFDVVGLLGEFETCPLGHPPYALVNENKEIICLVTPETGIDLNQHVGRTIGVNGILGVYKKPGKPDSRHITVRVVEVMGQ